MTIEFSAEAYTTFGKCGGLGPSPRKILVTTRFRCSENEGNALFSYIFAFHARYGTDSSNRFDEIVSTMAANSRDPCSQRYVQTEITMDIEMIGSGGRTSGKFLKICILLGLKCLFKQCSSIS